MRGGVRLAPRVTRRGRSRCCRGAAPARPVRPRHGPVGAGGGARRPGYAEAAPAELTLVWPAVLPRRVAVVGACGRRSGCRRTRPTTSSPGARATSRCLPGRPVAAASGRPRQWCSTGRGRPRAGAGALAELFDEDVPDHYWGTLEPRVRDAPSGTSAQLVPCRSTSSSCPSPVPALTPGSSGRGGGTRRSAFAPATSPPGRPAATASARAAQARSPSGAAPAPSSRLGGGSRVPAARAARAARAGPCRGRPRPCCGRCRPATRAGRGRP